MYRYNPLFSLLFVILFSIYAQAQTPDGQTPAEETVCDGETGAAFGLCNAYCEAMDCDSDTPQASEKACSKVAEKFENLTGGSLPCEENCPCAGEGGIWAFFSEPTSCTIFPSLEAIGLSNGLDQIFVLGNPEDDGGICGSSREEPGLPLNASEVSACIGVLKGYGITCQ